MAQSTLERINSFNNGFESGRIETTKKLVSTMYNDDEVIDMLNDFFDDHVNAQNADIKKWFNEHKK
jgi:hypothetical protein